MATLTLARCALLRSAHTVGTQSFLTATLEIIAPSTWG